MHGTAVTSNRIHGFMMASNNYVKAGGNGFKNNAIILEYK